MKGKNARQFMGRHGLAIFLVVVAVLLFLLFSDALGGSGSLGR